MLYLNRQASSLYLRLCRASLYLGIIGHHLFLARMHALAEMSRSSDPNWKFASRLLSMEEWGSESTWKHNPNEEALDSETHNVGVSMIAAPNEDEDDQYLALLVPALRSGLSSWVIHKGDPDPFPSVPHGHEHNNDKKKLDIYLGHIYLKGNPAGREPRESIIRLWNDPQFRSFVREAIEHFMYNNPTFKWRIADPLRLPRVRHG